MVNVLRSSARDRDRARTPGSRALSGKVARTSGSCLDWRVSRPRQSATSAAANLPAMNDPAADTNASGRPRRFRGRIATIGYEGRSIDEFVALLVAADVDILVDVREQAMSRRKGFSKRALTSAVEAADIVYRHEPRLGNPKANRDPFRSGSEVARQTFLAHLNNGSRAKYDEVVELARDNVVALVCFERAHEQCHRSCISAQAQSEHPSLSVERL